jgi:hypothetical protein
MPGEDHIKWNTTSKKKAECDLFPKHKKNETHHQVAAFL